MDIEQAKLGSYSAGSPEEQEQIEKANKLKLEAEAEQGLASLSRAIQKNPEVVRELLRKEIKGVSEEEIDQMLSVLGKGSEGAGL